MMTPSPLFVLLGAARYFDLHEWQQGDLGEHGGPRCAFGALLSAAYGDSVERPRAEQDALTTAACTLRKCIIQDAQRTASIYVWNDSTRQTRYNVLARITQAAELLAVSAP